MTTNVIDYNAIIKWFGCDVGLVKTNEDNPATQFEENKIPINHIKKFIRIFFVNENTKEQKNVMLFKYLDDKEKKKIHRKSKEFRKMFNTNTHGEPHIERNDDANHMAFKNILQNIKYTEEEKIFHLDCIYYISAFLFIVANFNKPINKNAFIALAQNPKTQLFVQKFGSIDANNDYIPDINKIRDKFIQLGHELNSEMSHVAGKVTFWQHDVDETFTRNGKLKDSVDKIGGVINLNNTIAEILQFEKENTKYVIYENKNNFILKLFNELNKIKKMDTDKKWELITLNVLNESTGKSKNAFTHLFYHIVGLKNTNLEKSLFKHNKDFDKYWLSKININNIIDLQLTNINNFIDKDNSNTNTNTNHNDCEGWLFFDNNFLYDGMMPTQSRSKTENCSGTFVKEQNCKNFLYECLYDGDIKDIKYCVDKLKNFSFETEIKHMNPTIALTILQKFGFKTKEEFDGTKNDGEGAYVKKIINGDEWLHVLDQEHNIDKKIINEIRTHELFIYLKKLSDFINDNIHILNPKLSKCNLVIDQNKLKTSQLSQNYKIKKHVAATGLATDIFNLYKYSLYGSKPLSIENMLPFITDKSQIFVNNNPLNFNNLQNGGGLLKNSGYAILKQIYDNLLLSLSNENKSLDDKDVNKINELIKNMQTTENDILKQIISIKKYHNILKLYGDKSHEKLTYNDLQQKIYDFKHNHGIYLSYESKIMKILDRISKELPIVSLHDGFKNIKLN
jgi:hypothetical protein